jgi:V-type H+-transporting ATPase subunit D
MSKKCTHSHTDINSELDELDREEFYRLKKVSNKKQRDTAAQDAEILAKRQQQEEKGEDVLAEADTISSGDILGQEDVDVIF